MRVLSNPNVGILQVMNLINRLAVNSKTSNVNGKAIELYVSKVNINDAKGTMTLNFIEDLNNLDVILERRALGNKIANAKRKNKKDAEAFAALTAQCEKFQTVRQTIYIGKFMGGKTPTNYQAYFATPARSHNMINKFFMKFIQLGGGEYDAAAIEVATPFIEKYEALASDMSAIYDTFDGLRGEDKRLDVDNYKLFMSEKDVVNAKHMRNLTNYFKALATFLSENKMSAKFSVADGKVKAFKA